MRESKSLRPVGVHNHEEQLVIVLDLFQIIWFYLWLDKVIIFLL
jgi:hypothetical protein